MSHPDLRLTAYEKVQRVWLYPLIVLRTVPLAISTVLHDRTIHHLRRTVVTSFLHNASSTLSFRHKLAPLNIPTGVAIAGFCTARKLAHITVTVPVPESYPAESAFPEADTVPPATLHFITPPPRPSISVQPMRTVLCLHGGGYAHPISAGANLAFALRCAAAARASSLAVLEYGLAPELRYPGQLVQALAALRVLLGRGVPPGEIVLLGDSAGGNAVLGVLACLVTGHGGLVGLGGRRLGAAVLVSPWCGMSTERASYKTNERWDYLSAKAMAEFEEAWGAKRGEVWGDMLGAADADGERWGERFWTGVCNGEERVVERILVTAGTREVFLDDVSEMARLMGANASDGEGRVKFIKSANEGHVSAVVDTVVGIEDGEMLPAALAFMESL